MKLREGNIFSRVCHSVHRGVPCNHYPWCIGPHCTVVAITRDLFNLVQFGTPPNSPPVLTSGAYWSTYASYWNAFYHPQTKLREGNVLHLSVSHSVHREGPPGQRLLLDRDSSWTETPLDRDFPWTETPWTETPWTETPWTETPLNRDPLYGNQWAVRILLEFDRS